MSSCVLCASLLGVNHSKTRFTTRDEARSHVNHHLLQTEHFDNENRNSLERMFEQCFPNFVVTPARKQKKVVVKKEGRQSLLDVCRTALNGRVSKASPRVTCQKCGSKIKLYSGVKRTGLVLGNAINHASTHLGIDLFECRKCERSFGSKSAVIGHLISSHGQGCLSEYFTDKSHDFIDEITNSIEQCFSDDDYRPSGEKARMIRLKEEVRVRSLTKGSNLAVERQLFCYRLIRQLAGDNETIQCRVCSRRIGIKQESGYTGDCAMAHALVHLKRPLFICKVCSNARHTRKAMYFHLKSTHVLPLSNNYDCLADEFHADVLDMLRKCYADEFGK